MEDSRAEFDATDVALLDQALRETEAVEAAAVADQATGDDGAAPAAPAAPTEGAPAAPAAPAQADAAAPAAPAAAPAALAADANGSTKAALRAARHEAKDLRNQLAAATKRLEEAGVTDGDPSAPGKTDEPDESQLNDVREYAPTVGKKLDALLAENAALRAANPASSTPAPAPFVPKQYDERTQAEIDESPDLLLWQMSPEPEHQRLFAATEKAHELLMMNPGFENKPASERFAAAVAIAKGTVVAPSKASSQKTLEDAQRVIASAAATPGGARTMGDLRGGAPAAINSFRDPHEQARQGLSDEEIMASLPALP